MTTETTEAPNAPPAFDQPTAPTVLVFSAAAEARRQTLDGIRLRAGRRVPDEIDIHLLAKLISAGIVISVPPSMAVDPSDPAEVSRIEAEEARDAALIAAQERNAEEGRAEIRSREIEQAIESARVLASSQMGKDRDRQSHQDIIDALTIQREMIEEQVRQIGIEAATKVARVLEPDSMMEAAIEKMEAAASAVAYQAEAYDSKMRTVADVEITAAEAEESRRHRWENLVDGPPLKSPLDGDQSPPLDGDVAAQAYRDDAAYRGVAVDDPGNTPGDSPELIDDDDDDDEEN